MLLVMFQFCLLQMMYSDTNNDRNNGKIAQLENKLLQCIGLNGQ